MTDNTREKLRAVFLAAIMVISVFGMTVAFAGSAAAATNASGNQNVVLGAEAQPLGMSGTPYTISETSDDFGGSGSGEITVPDGVTFNQSASDLTVRQTSSGSLSNVRFEDSQTIKFDYSGFGTASDDSISFGQLYVDVGQDAGASFDVSSRVGVNSQTLTVTTNQASISGPSESFGAASSGNIIGPVTVSTPTVDGQIGNQTDLVVYANQSNGITWDTSVDVASTITDHNDNVNESAATITAEKIVVPVTSDFSSGDSVDFDGLAVNVSADASASALSVEATPASDTGGSLTSDTGDQISVTKPSVSLGSSLDLAVGLEGQSIGGNSITVTSSADGDIGDATNVTVMLNDSDVTFDTSAGVSVTVNGETKNAPAVVNENNLTVNVSGDFESGDNVVFDSFSFNVTNEPADGTDVKVSAETQSDPGAAVITSEDTSTFITLQRPDLTYTGDTVDVDNDGETGVSISDVTATSAVNGDIADNTNVTLSIADGSGVTFDQSNAADIVALDGTEEQSPVINEKNITVNVSSITSGDAVTFQNLGVNVTSDATNTTLAVTTNTSDAEVTTELSNQIVIDKLSPGSIKADANTSDGVGFTNVDFGEDTSPENDASNPEVTETVTGSVYVEDGSSAFGDADVNLEIVKTPEGSSGASLNATTVTTASDGTADFNFTAGDTTGDYVVNASIDGVSGGVNITYTAQPGEVADITVEPIENSIAGRSSELGQAAMWVNATDQYGNPVDTGATVDVFVENADASEVGAFNDTAADGSHTDFSSVDDDLTDGQFDIHGDGSSVIEVRSSNPKDVTVTVAYDSAEDSGTVTVFDSIGTINVELNKTSAITGQTVQANATIAEADGTTIEVPDVGVTFEETTTSNTSLGMPSGETDTAGFASTTFTADSAGDATIRAKTNLKQDTTSLTIEDPTLNVSTDVDSVTAGEETTVNATVTYEHNGSAAEGATVNVTGAGVDVADQTTDANGNASFSVSPSEAGTITVNATKAGTNMGQATIEAVKQEVQLNLTANETTVSEGDTVKFTLTNDDTDAAVSGTVTVNGTDYTTGSDGMVNVTFDTAGTYTATGHKASTSTADYLNDTVDITVQEPAQPTATVTFDNATVQNGTETVTVQSANYTLADGTAGEYVVVLHVVQDDGSLSSPVGFSGNLSGQTDTIEIDLNATDAQGDALDTLTENVTLRAMLHEPSADSAYGAALTIDGAQVTDDATITVEEPVTNPAKKYDTDGDGEVDTSELQTAIDDWAAGADGALTTQELQTLIDIWAQGGSYSDFPA